MTNEFNFTENLIRPLELEETPEQWKTWVFGMIIITAASFLSPAAILMVPLLRETIYERIMIFLVALGIGAMSGSCIFILIPQAFNITDVTKIDYVTKSWLMISALYAFFTVDRILQYIVEYRRRKRQRCRVHSSTIDTILNQARRGSKIHSKNILNYHFPLSAEKNRKNSKISYRQYCLPPPKKSSKAVNEETIYNNNVEDRNQNVVGPKRKKSALTHQHSLIIDENGNVVNNKTENDIRNGHNIKQVFAKTDQTTNNVNMIIDEKLNKKSDNIMNVSINGNLRMYNEQNNNNHDTTTNGEKFHLNIKNFHHSHHPSRRKSTIDADQKRHRLSEECHNLEDDLEIAMVNNALARTLSTRRRLAIIKDETPDVIQYKNSDGIFYTIPNGVEHQNNAKSSADILHTSGDVISDKKRRNSSWQSDEELDLGIEIHEKVVIEKSKLEVASVAYMIIFGSSANNFVDGMSTGAAFSDSIIRGITIGLAVLSQQFPQELGTLAILAKSGLGIRRALLFNMLPITLSYVGFAFGVFLDNVDDSYDSFIFAISAGMYFYIFLGTLIPEIRQSFYETLKKDTREAALITVLQFSGILFGISFLYMLN